MAYYMDSAFKNQGAFPGAYRHPNFAGYTNGYEQNGRGHSADKKERFTAYQDDGPSESNGTPYRPYKK